MKKWIGAWLLVFVLTGCRAVETFESLGNVEHISPGPARLRQVVVSLPSNAALETVGMDTEVTVYHCGNFDMVLQNFSSGDLSGSIRSLCGFSADQLTVMETTCGDHTRHEWVWTAVSEEGEMVCRGAILDDGDHHYALYVMAPSAEAGALQSQWNALFASFCLEN